MNRRHFLSSVTTGACIGAFTGPARADAIYRPWPKGQPTPPLQLGGYGGPAWNLAELKGRPVLLNFWASWCEPCRAEMPSLELLAQKHEGAGLQVLAVNHRETDAAIKGFMDSMPISLPIVRDRDGATTRAFGVRVFPSSILIGRDGRARFTVIGEVDWLGAQAAAWLQAHL